MLHINTETNPSTLAAGGSPIDIAADFCYASGKLYAAMSRADPKAAEMLRDSLVTGVTNPDSPTWKLRQRPGEIAIATRIPQERE